jgi:predicted AAA+ superfamily ATPase
LHTLLGLETIEQVAGHPIYGASWEGFALETLLAQLSWPATAHFYRTAVGAEIDLVIERPDSSIWAIEIKRGLSAKLERGFYTACEDLKPAKSFVVHSGEDRYPVTKEIEAIGLRELAELLRAEGA